MRDRPKSSGKSEDVNGVREYQSLLHERIAYLEQQNHHILHACYDREVRAAREEGWPATLLYEDFVSDIMDAVIARLEGE